MRLSQIGEFRLIDRIGKKIRINPQRVKVGIGDDAAVIKTSKDKLLIVTTDTLIENIHFNLKHITFFKLGFKALSVNISDVAAMGGYPTETLITLGLPNNFTVKAVDEIYRGIENLAKRYKIDIIGGDTTSSPKEIVISITLLGEVLEEELVLRSGARVGDLILVTGDLGASAAGLELLRKSKVESRKLKVVIKKHLMPEPRVEEARVIAESKLATSMIDNSDGLSRSLIEITRLSRVGARIWLEALPIRKETKLAARTLRKSELELALDGGEDYELIFTTPKNQAVKLSEMIQKKTKTKATVIGEIIPPKQGIKVLESKGYEKNLKYRGYEHFKS